MAERKETRHVARFKVRWNDGRTELADAFVTYIHSEGLSGSRPPVVGSHMLQLESGGTLELLDDTSFRVDETGEVVHLVEDEDQPSD